MPTEALAGPLRTVHGPGGVDAPLYVVPFDKRGTCTGPATRDRLVEQAKDATDVFVFSHGWNNDWATATRRYDDFVATFLKVRADRWSPPSRHYAPVLAGVFWPSTALVAPWEQAPDIAGGGAPRPAAGVEDFAAGMSPTDADRFYALSDRPRLGAEDARTLVELVSSQLGGEDEAAGEGQDVRDPDGLLAAWHAVSVAGTTAADRTSSATGRMLDDDDDEDAGDVPAQDSAPDAAGLGWGDLDPRKLFRLTTVLLMKDRAGAVGSSGVADLLGRLHTAAPDARVHLVGHSYGCKIVLSALRACADRVPAVDSVLLLQAAISAYCFAPAGGVPGSTEAGGYHAVLTRSRRPILATFSRQDRALHDAFHWAARRAGDLGEADVAADEPPSRYAALGGYGPRGLACPVVDAVEPPTPYDLPADGGGVVGVRATGLITGHGDVVSATTSWMLLSQVMS